MFAVTAAFAMCSNKHHLSDLYTYYDAASPASLLLYVLYSGPGKCFAIICLCFQTESSNVQKCAGTGVGGLLFKKATFPLLHSV